MLSSLICRALFVDSGQAAEALHQAHAYETSVLPAELPQGLCRLP